MSLLDKATTGASRSYWEALKVDFALEMSDKKHIREQSECVVTMERYREIDQCE